MAATSSSSSSGGLLDWWHRRGAWKRARLEGRHLCKEARRILKKKSHRIPQAVAAEIEGACSAVDQALNEAEAARGQPGQELERVRKAITALDDAMDQHLSFA